MLSVSTLRAVRTIVTHGDCPDGIASALLLHDALPEAEILFMQHGTDAHRALEAREGILFCDFAPSHDRAAEFARVGTIVLDHHRTAKDVVFAMGKNGVFGDEQTEPGTCGAVLAYRHVWLPLCGDSPLRRFAEHFATVAGVRDTWQKKSEHWREACAQAELLLSLPQSWWLEQPLAQITSRWTEKLLPLGNALVEKHEDRVQHAIAQAYRFVAGGKRFVIVTGVGVTSDAAGLLGASADVVVGFDYAVQHGRPMMRVSLRSEEGAFDCAAFASQRGGGGHTRAAGFGLELEPGDPQPYTLIERLFAAQSP